MKINSLSSVCTAALFSAVFAGGCPQGNTDSGSPAPSRQTSTAVSQTAVVADTVVFVQSEPSKPKRDGAYADPILRATLSNGLIVERRGKNSALKVIDPDGKKSGQQ